jgi:radical SAM protein with 4Fe4S-binding SPASM domain
MLKNLNDALPLKYPLALAIDPVNLCNFRCKFCPTGTELGKTHRPNGLMKLENFKKIIDDLHVKNVKLKSLKLWKDGEPLLHKQLPEMILYAKRKKVCQETRITTNGTLLDRFGEKLVTSGLDWIMISYLSPRKEEYEKHSGSLSDPQKKILENIIQLKKFKDKHKSKTPHIVVKMCNFPYVTKEDINKLYNDFEEHVDQIEITELPMNWDGNHYNDFTLGDKRTKNFRNKVCPYAWYQLNINWNGDVSICAVDWSFKTVVGNALEESIVDIWNGKKLNDFREMFSYQKQKNHPACGTCNYYYDHKDNIDNYALKV